MNEDLFNRFMKGNPEALNQVWKILYEILYNAVSRFVLGISRNDEDCVQEAFLKLRDSLILEIKNGRLVWMGPDAFVGYFRNRVLNHARNCLRRIRSGRRRIEIHSLFQLIGEGEGLPLGDTLPDQTPGPEEILIGDEDRRRRQQIVKDLLDDPGMYGLTDAEAKTLRAIWEALEISECPDRRKILQTAREQLGVNQNTFYINMSRLRQRLSDCLSRLEG